MSFTVSTGTISTKMWLSLYFMGCVSFEWYCGKMYSYHLFSSAFTHFTNNINRDSMDAHDQNTVHNNRWTVQQWTAEVTATRLNNGTMGGSKLTNDSQPLWKNYSVQSVDLIAWRLTSSKQYKCRDLHPKWLHRESNDNRLSTAMNNNIFVNEGRI